MPEIDELDAVARLSASDIFGVVVRSVGLLVTLSAICMALYWFADFVGIFGPPHLSSQFFLVAVIEFAGGIALLRGNWIVRLAYAGP
jgi:hypothetical protein